MAFTALQQAKRGEYLGGSEVAAVLGLDARKTAFDVWYQKQLIRGGGALPAQDQNPDDMAAVMGTLLEPVIRQVYVMKHPSHSWKPADLVIHPLHSFVGATPDGYIVMPELATEAVGEIKTKNWRTAREFGDSGTDEVPDVVLAQVQWQLLATGKRHAKILVLVDGRDYREYHIQADSQLHADMLEVVDPFWHDNILGNVPPTDIRGASVGKWLAEKFAKHGETVRAANADERAMIQTLLTARQERDQWEERVEILSDNLRLLIGEDAGLQSPEAKVTWKKVKDSTRLEASKALEWMKNTAGIYVADRTAMASLPATREALTSFITDYIKDAIGANTREMPGTRRFLVTQAKEK